MLILVLAANTAYADFPRLASIVARDGYLPRQFMNQGDRLAFSNGIIVLSVFAADPDRRVPRRHAVAAPALHDRRVRLVHAVAGRHGHPLAADATSRAGRRSALINGFGAVVTGVVLVIVAVTKTLEGAWIVLLLIPLIVVVFKATRRHYDHVAAQLTLRGYAPQRASAQHRDRADRRHASARSSKRCATRETLSDDVRAVYVDVDPARDRAAASADWDTWGGRVHARGARRRRTDR